MLVWLFRSLETRSSLNLSRLRFGHLLKVQKTGKCLKYTRSFVCLPTCCEDRWWIFCYAKKGEREESFWDEIVLCHLLNLSRFFFSFEFEGLRDFVIKLITEHIMIEEYSNSQLNFIIFLTANTKFTLNYKNSSYNQVYVVKRRHWKISTMNELWPKIPSTHHIFNLISTQDKPRSVFQTGRHGHKQKLIHLEIKKLYHHKTILFFFHFTPHLKSGKSNTKTCRAKNSPSGRKPTIRTFRLRVWRSIWNWMALIVRNASSDTTWLGAVVCTSHAPSANTSSATAATKISSWAPNVKCRPTALSSVSMLTIPEIVCFISVIKNRTSFKAFWG